MRWSLGFVLWVSTMVPLAACSLLFEETGTPEVVESDYANPMVVRIGSGATDHFESVAQWYEYRTSDPDLADGLEVTEGYLPRRQLLRVSGEPASSIHGKRLKGDRSGCSGFLRGISRDRDVTDMLLVDVDSRATPCEAGDTLSSEDGSDARINYIVTDDSLGVGMSETLRFTTSPVLGPLTIFNNLGTTPDHRLILEGATSHQGNPGGAKSIVLKNGETSDVALRIEASNVTVRDLEVQKWKNDAASRNDPAIEIVGDYITLESLLIHGDGNQTGGAGDGVVIGATAEGARIRNSIFYSIPRAAIHYVRGDMIQDPDREPGKVTDPPVVSNCTIYGCVTRSGTSQGGKYSCISTSRDSFTIVNTIAVVGKDASGGQPDETRRAFGQELFGGEGALIGRIVGDIDTGYNASDDSTAPGPNSEEALDEYFFSPLANDFHLRSESALGTLGRCLNSEATNPGGQNVRDTFNFDIDGQERIKEKAWSIGADQIDVGSAACAEQESQ